MPATTLATGFHGARAKAITVLMALTIATGGAFVSVPATASSRFCANGIPWSTAEDHVGENRSVKGPVKSTVFSKNSNGRPTFLNLDNPFPDPNRFTVVIWGRNRDNFPEPPERTYKGELICVTGHIRSFEGVSEIFANRPNDIDIR